MRSHFEISGSIRFSLLRASFLYTTCHTFDQNDLKGLKKVVMFTLQLWTVTMQEEILNSQCFDLPKMKKEVESGYKIIDEMIWQLFQFKNCATINCALKHFEDSQFIKKKQKVNSFGIQYQYCLMFQTPFEVTPSWPIKVRSVT